MIVRLFSRSQWAILFLTLVGFVYLAWLANTTVVPSFDRHLLLSLRDPMDSAQALGPSWFAELVRDITALGSNWILLFFCFCYAVFLVLNGKKTLVVYLVSSVVVGMLLSLALKMGFDRPRPDLVPHGSKVYTSSFPSGHAMSSTLAWLTLALVVSWNITRISVKRFVIGVALLIAVLVSFSRVYLGVHWPSDVLAGLCAGIFWAVLCYGVARCLCKEGSGF